VRDGDPIRIRIDCRNMTGTVDFDGYAEELNARPASDKLKQVPNVPDDTRLWAALQNVSGGTWGGCVYDVEAILAKLNA